MRLGKMNLAVHGLGGDIRQGNTYYEDLHTSTAGGGKFDFVMANPPFNVDRVDKDRLKDDPRFPSDCRGWITVCATGAPLQPAVDTRRRCQPYAHHGR